MQMHRCRNAVLLLLVAAAESVLILGAGLVAGTAQQLRRTAFAIVESLVGGVGSLLPRGFVAGLAAILGVLGAGWWVPHLIVPAVSGESGTDLPALGGVLAAPAYLAVRRFTKPDRRPDAQGRGSPAHRIYMVKGTRLRERLSSAVQVPSPPPSFATG